MFRWRRSSYIGQLKGEIRAKDGLRRCSICLPALSDPTALVLDAKSIWKDKKIIQKYSTALEIAHSNYILLTSEGTLALGPPNTRVGDQTSIISGGLCPYILRRNTKTQHLERAAFDLVEDCVLDRTPPREPEELETVFLV
ncbi:hypothetical protein BFJ69_g10986 [Fusarium oxysporum]|uniref:Heterokaryon incompatibility domain-containing protein n=1 Tax=Fusarium oxysporum TaxID=5507 RepID=A0A420MTP9_FUSOX|nr:hypothetical protein BFJ69_g10986 [Fusarium oxysporum]